jgi:alpha-methylacyl-CoA racemase
MAGLAPGPFAACMLADMGADVVRVDRPGPAPPIGPGLLGRGRRSVAVDLKHPEGTAVVLDLVDRADILIEGYRPGVMERLGLGPGVCLARNPSLVYGRMTGFGQDGPLSGAAGHDINYISLSGALAMIGRAGQPPTPPLNLVGDFGGGGMLLAFGLLCALLNARSGGGGQVVDAAMIDGTSMLLLPFFGAASGATANSATTVDPDAALDDRRERPERGHNLLDSGAPFYDAYETSDGRWVSVGAIEPQFYAALLRGLGLDPTGLPPQMDRSGWPDTKALFASVIRTRTRDEWCEIFAAGDACVAPVLELGEVASYPHNAARGSHIEVSGVKQPAPAPRLSVTPGAVRRPPPRIGEHTDEVLKDWADQNAEQISELRRSGAIA